VWLKKARGESGVGPHWWPGDGSVIEVPDQLAADLLAIPDGGYTKADPPKPEPKPVKAAASEPPKAEAAPPAKA